ncbi:hypothetical protein FV217_14935 [Methylobacterium sp. WL9]|nr:hypothetical protein FV217_14935 [Methylobacterium sp. WL9]
MKQTPLRPPSLTAVFMELAELTPDRFDRLSAEIDSPDAFDHEKERVAALVPILGKDEDTLGAIISATSFLYQRIHKSSGEISDLPKLVGDIVVSILEQDDSEPDEKPDEAKTQLIIDRLAHLLRFQENASRFTKHERLRWGFLPAATDFSTFVDLRPSLSDDLSEVVELIPTIQFRIKTDSSSPLMKSLVFQLDPRNLKRLKAEVERAEQKLNTLMNDVRLTGMMSKRRP